MQKHSVKSDAAVHSHVARQPGLVSSLREMLLLGKLLVRSCNANDLLHALDEFSDDGQRITPRVFQSLLNRLQVEHLISKSPPHAAGQHEAFYKITSVGLARFRYLMSSEHESVRSRQVFRAKLLNLGHVDRSTRRRIARAYMQQILCAQIQAIGMHGFFQHDAKLSDPDKLMMLRIIRRERAIAEAEIEWMRADMAEYL